MFFVFSLYSLQWKVSIVSEKIRNKTYVNALLTVKGCKIKNETPISVFKKNL